MILFIGIVIALMTIRYAIYPLLCDLLGFEVDHISFKSPGWKLREENRKLLKNESLTRGQRKHIEHRLEILNNEHSN
jgi:hypothetical protein